MAAKRLCAVIRTRVPWLTACRPRANWIPIVRRATLSSTALLPRTQLQSKEHTTREGSRNGLGILSLVGLFGLFSQEDDSDTVPVSVKSAILSAQGHQSAGDYLQAEADYHNALQLLMESSHAGTRPFLEARAVVLDKLANMYLEMGKLDEALANFKETMKLMLACDVPEKSSPMVEISLKISKIYSNQKELVMAAAGFEWCVNTAMEIVANSDDKTNDVALLGMCLTDKGQFHLIEGNGKAALECFMKGYGISVFLHGFKGVQTTVMSSNCATALDLMGFHDEACQLLESVISASQEHCKSDPEHMATLYTNLGTIRANQGDLESACTAYEAGVEYAGRMTDKKLYEHLQQIIQELKDKK